MLADPAELQRESPKSVNISERCKLNTMSTEDQGEKERTVTCANPKCGRYFKVTTEQAILNTKLRCPHCGKASEYDLLRLLHG